MPIDYKLARLVSIHGDIETKDENSVYYIHKQESVKFGNYLAIINVFEHRMEFKVFEYTEFTGPNGHGEQYPSLRGVSSDDDTEDIYNAQSYFEGTIKWDGCCNVIYSDQNNCMLHYCGISDYRESHNMIEGLYNYASENIPSWDDL